LACACMLKRASDRFRCSSAAERDAADRNGKRQTRRRRRRRAPSSSATDTQEKFLLHLSCRLLPPPPHAQRRSSLSSHEPTDQPSLSPLLQAKQEARVREQRRCESFSESVSRARSSVQPAPACVLAPSWARDPCRAITTTLWSLSARVLMARAQRILSPSRKFQKEKILCARASRHDSRHERQGRVFMDYIELRRCRLGQRGPGCGVCV
jgi:hypothetical protein